jgi:tRNA threonylcarbamoyladenosine biosynthesis protein TsaE
MTAGTLVVAAPTPEATRRCGAVLGGLIAPGDVVLLTGGLGAGKTTFTQGLVAALGHPDAVTSPTFTLMRTYATEPVVAHVDCWRMEQLVEVADLGLEEILDEGGVAVIEWGEAAAPLLGRDALVVTLEPEPFAAEVEPPAGRARRIAFRAVSGAWDARLVELGGRLEAAFGPSGVADRPS